MIIYAVIHGEPECGIIKEYFLYTTREKAELKYKQLMKEDKYYKDINRFKMYWKIEEIEVEE